MCFAPGSPCSRIRRMAMNLSIFTAGSRACAPYFRARVFLSCSINYRCPYFVLDHHHTRPGRIFLIALLCSNRVAEMLKLRKPEPFSRVGRFIGQTHFYC